MILEFLKKHSIKIFIFCIFFALISFTATINVWQHLHQKTKPFIQNTSIIPANINNNAELLTYKNPNIDEYFSFQYRPNWQIKVTKSQANDTHILVNELTELELTKNGEENFVLKITARTFGTTGGQGLSLFMVKNLTPNMVLVDAQKNMYRFKNLKTEPTQNVSFLLPVDNGDFSNSLQKMYPGNYDYAQCSFIDWDENGGYACGQLNSVIGQFEKCSIFYKTDYAISVIGEVDELALKEIDEIISSITFRDSSQTRRVGDDNTRCI